MATADTKQSPSGKKPQRPFHNGYVTGARNGIGAGLKALEKFGIIDGPTVLDFFRRFGPRAYDCPQVEGRNHLDDVALVVLGEMSAERAVKTEAAPKPAKGKKKTVGAIMDDKVSESLKAKAI